MDKNDRFLPIGSIVGLKNNSSPYMIIKMGVNNESYLGIKHPYGYESEKGIIRIKREDITDVYFIGYINKKIEEQRQKLDYRQLVGGEKDGQRRN